MPKLVLVAVGGNALIRAGQKGTAQEQFQNAAETANVAVKLIKAGYRLVLTHGNGPQVGAQLVRSELAAAYAYRMPIDCCVAATQGEIGYVLQYAMWQAMQAEGLNTPVVSLVTQVLVDPDDPAFRVPTKPVGPFYTRDEAYRYRDLFDWHMVEDLSRGYRRVVASPEPKGIVELEAIRACVDRGLVVIAAVPLLERVSPAGVAWLFAGMGLIGLIFCTAQLFNPYLLKIEDKAYLDGLAEGPSSLPKVS